MKEVKKERGVLFLDKQRIYLWIQQGAAVFSVDLPTTVAHDLEIVNREELTKFIAWFVSAHKVPPSHLTIILSENLLFRKKLAGAGDAAEQEKAAFIASVPFEHVGHRVYGAPGQPQEVVATNSDFVELIKEGFEKQGFSAGSVIPTIFLADISMTARVPDIAGAAEVLKRLDSLKEFSILTEHEETGLVLTDENIDEKPKTKPFLIYLLIGLGILLIILGVVIYMQFTTPPQAPKRARAKPTIAPSNVKTTSPNGVQLLTKEKVRIVIKIPEGTQSSGDAIKGELEKAGFSSVETSIGQTIQSESTLIVFTPLVSSTDRSPIQDAVGRIVQGAIVKEEVSASHDVVITLQSSTQ